MSEFKYAIPIARAFKTEDGKMMLEGIASSTTKDSHETIFSEECQQGFVEDISEGIKEKEPVLCEAEHKSDEMPLHEIGWVVDGELNQNQTRVLIELDPDNPQAVYYFNKMTKKDPKTGKVKKFGLSINGYAQRSHINIDGIRVFDRVKLRKVGIVRAPSNPDAWITSILRSLEKSEKTKVNNDASDLIIESEEFSHLNNFKKEEMMKEKEKAPVVLREQEDEAQTTALEQGTEQEEAVPAETVETEEEVQETEVERQELSEDVKRGMLKDMLNYMIKQEKFDAQLRAVEEVMSMTRDCLMWARYESDPEAVAAGIIRDFSDVTAAIFVGDDVTERMTAMRQLHEALRALDSQNAAALQTEEIDEEITETERSENQAVTVEVKLDAEQLRAELSALQEKIEGLELVSRSEMVEVVGDILKEQLNAFKTEKEELVRSASELQEIVNTQKEEIEKLSRSLVEADERIARIEKTPSTLPGVVLRNEKQELTDAEKLKREYDEAIKSGDTQKAFKLYLGL